MEDKFANQIDSKYVYRIPQKYLCDLDEGIKKAPYQKMYKLQAGSQEFTADFKSCNRQFDWLKISLLYDKSDKHLTNYDSYNVESAARMIKKLSDQTYQTHTAQQI